MHTQKSPPTAGTVERPHIPSVGALDGNSDTRPPSRQATSAATWGGHGDLSPRPPQGAAIPDFAAGAPLVLAPYGHIPLKQWASGRSKISSNHPLLIPAVSEPRVEIYPYGFSWRQARFCDQKQPDHLKDTTRGEITGLSSKATRRLRELMLTTYREGCDPHAVTLTTHTWLSPEAWRSMVKRFRMLLRRKLPDWPAVWRVELQLRKTPHLHCLWWAPSELPVEVVKEVIEGLWLKACREDKDRHSRNHAVKVRLLDGPGWLRYCTCHDTKHKQEQLGWLGKQWGVWNEKALQDRPPTTEGEVTEEDLVKLCRALKQHSRRRFKRKDGRLDKPKQFHANRNKIAYCMASDTIASIFRVIDRNDKPKNAERKLP